MAFLHVELTNNKITNVAVQRAGSSPSTMLGYQFIYLTEDDVAFYVFEHQEEAKIDGEKLSIKNKEYMPVAYNFVSWKVEYHVDSFGYITTKERVLASAASGIYEAPILQDGLKPRWDFEQNMWIYE